MEAMVQACQSHGIVPLLVIPAINVDFISTTEGWHRTFVAVYQRAADGLEQIAQSHGIGILDARDGLFYPQGSLTRRELFYDHSHLTAAGNRALAQIVSDGLRTLHPDLFAAPDE